MRRKIGDILGSSPLDSDGNRRYEKLCDWSTGATSTFSRSTSIYNRVHPRVHGTSGAVGVFTTFRGVPLHNVKIVRGNRFSQVAKTYKINRPIACEPTLNAFLQKGVGRFIRTQLKNRAHIDLDNGADVNRHLVSCAIELKLCTLDLESASDTLSSEFVRYVLPHSWWTELENIRSPVISIDGKWKHLSKHASMGNGYIFELETLIFWSIVSTINELTGTNSPVSVFGDDIICASSISDLVMKTLTFCGFRINKDKSFTSGVFYESCGHHYYDGRLCTPPYQKGRLHSRDTMNRLFEIIACHNRLYRWSLRVADLEFTHNARVYLMSLGRRICLRYDDIPRLHFTSTADFGFLVNDDSLLDKNGDYLSPLALVLSTSPLKNQDGDLIYHTGEWFYYENWLNGRNSFITNRQGQCLKYDTPRYKIRKNFKSWRATATYS